MISYKDKPYRPSINKRVIPFKPVQDLARQRGMTISKLAENTGLYKAYFTWWKKGNHYPDFGILLRIANVLNINVLEILDKDTADELKYNQKEVK